MFGKFLSAGNLVLFIFGMLSFTGEFRTISAPVYGDIDVDTAYDLDVNSSYSNRVLNVNTSVLYGTIQAAIDDPRTLAGHTIFVEEGVYYENVVVTKGVSIVGENRCATIIDGNHTGTVVHLKSNKTRIEGFTLQNGYYGVLMSPWTQGIVIEENIIADNEYGIAGHYDVIDVTIFRNTITSNNNSGIDMLFSDSMISSNLISDNGKGEFQEYSSGIQISTGVNNRTLYCVNNTIFGNTIRNHRVGIWAVRYSEKNRFFHNNFIDNTEQVSASASTWNNSVTENYWSSYDGTDEDKDGFGDASHKIDEVIQDNRPLMGVFSRFITSRGYDVNIISNSTIDSFQHSEENSTITMFVSNTTLNQTTGFCRLTIPHTVLSPPYNVKINNDPVTHIVVFENRTSSIIYFNYAHSILRIVIIPETSSQLIVLLMLMTSTLLTAGCRIRKKSI
jgi:parallel beta-helix repeat protein